MSSILRRGVHYERPKKRSSLGMEHRGRPANGPGISARRVPSDELHDAPAVSPKPQPPTKSWWTMPRVQKNRDAFNRRLAKEQERMSGTREGRATASKIVEFVA